MYTVYVIKSEVGKVYIGQTEDLGKRLIQHNDPDFDKRSYTKLNGRNWEVVYKEELGSRSEAIVREKYLKSHAGRDWFRSKLTAR